MHTKPPLQSADPARSCSVCAIVPQLVCNLLSLQCYRLCAVRGYERGAKRFSTLEPTPRRAGFQLGTYWVAERGTKGVLPYGTLGMLASWPCMARVPCVRCRLPRCPHDAAHSSPQPGVLDFSWARIGAQSVGRKACCRRVIIIRGIFELSIIMVIRASLSLVRYVCVAYSITSCKCVCYRVLVLPG
jgi:hypothetical protein